MGGLKSEPLDAGVARTFVAPYEKVLQAARDATFGAGLSIEGSEQIDSTTTVMIAKRGASGWTWGELVRVVVQQGDSGGVTVRVLGKRKLATNVTARDNYSDAIFESIALALSRE